MRGRTRRSSVDANMVRMGNERLGGRAAGRSSSWPSDGLCIPSRGKSALEMGPFVDGRRPRFVGTHRLVAAYPVHSTRASDTRGRLLRQPQQLGQETTSAAFLIVQASRAPPHDDPTSSGRTARSMRGIKPSTRLVPAGSQGSERKQDARALYILLASRKQVS